MPWCKIYCFTSRCLLCQVSIFIFSNLKIPNTSILLHPLKSSFQWQRYQTDANFSWYTTSLAIQTRKKMSTKHKKWSFFSPFSSAPFHLTLNSKLAPFGDYTVSLLHNQECDGLWSGGFYHNAQSTNLYPELSTPRRSSCLGSVC